MELLSYSNRNLAENSKGAHGLLFATASTIFSSLEHFLPIGMVSDLNASQSHCYLLDGEGFPTPNQSACIDEYDQLADSHGGAVHYIPVKSECSSQEIIHLGLLGSFNCRDNSKTLDSKLLQLQDISYPNAGEQSPIQANRYSPCAHNFPDSQGRTSVSQGTDEVFLPTQLLHSLLTSQLPVMNFHPNMSSNVHYSNMQQYPDMTTMVNSNINIIAPMVETTFIDHKVCNVCGRRITRDMTRHMRTHQVVKRFVCDFPKGSCRHRSGQFNRRYDFKKHLLNNHFIFDNQNVKKVHNLKGKLDDWGTCHCGRRFISSDWLDNHILTEDLAYRCPLIYE